MQRSSYLHSPRAQIKHSIISFLCSSSCSSSNHCCSCGLNPQTFELSSAITAELAQHLRRHILPAQILRSRRWSSHHLAHHVHRRLPLRPLANSHSAPVQYSYGTHATDPLLHIAPCTKPVYHSKVLQDKGIIDKGIIRTKVLQDKGIVRN